MHFLNDQRYPLELFQISDLDFVLVYYVKLSIPSKTYPVCAPPMNWKQYILDQIFDQIRATDGGIPDAVPTILQYIGSHRL